MSNQVIVGIIFAVAVIVLCILKPNAGRIFLGFFYIVMAIGVNLILGITNPQSYIQMGMESPVTFYRELFSNIVAPNPMLFVLLVAAFQIVMGLLILYKQMYVKAGLIGTILFILAITPFGVHQLPWLGLPLAQIYLLTKRFDKTFLEMLRTKHRNTAPQ
jgi:hypothetical protein